MVFDLLFNNNKRDVGRAEEAALIGNNWQQPSMSPLQKYKESQSGGVLNSIWDASIFGQAQQKTKQRQAIAALADQVASGKIDRGKALAQYAGITGDFSTLQPQRAGGTVTSDAFGNPIIVDKATGTARPVQMSGGGGSGGNALAQYGQQMPSLPMAMRMGGGRRSPSPMDSQAQLSQLNREIMQTQNPKKLEFLNKKRDVLAGQADADKALKSKQTLAGSIADDLEQVLDNGLDSVSGLMGMIPNRPGSDAADTQARLDRVGSFLTLEEVQKLSGAVSDKDLEIAFKSASILNNPDAKAETREKEARRLLDIFRKASGGAGGAGGNANVSSTLRKQQPRLAPDGKYYVQDPSTGQYYEVSI
jgi:hypothetical protein